MEKIHGFAAYLNEDPKTDSPTYVLIDSHTVLSQWLDYLEDSFQDSSYDIHFIVKEFTIPKEDQIDDQELDTYEIPENFDKWIEIDSDESFLEHYHHAEHYEENEECSECKEAYEESQK